MDDSFLRNITMHMTFFCFHVGSSSCKTWNISETSAFFLLFFSGSQNKNVSEQKHSITHQTLTYNKKTYPKIARFVRTLKLDN